MSQLSLGDSSSASTYFSQEEKLNANRDVPPSPVILWQRRSHQVEEVEQGINKEEKCKNDESSVQNGNLGCLRCSNENLISSRKVEEKLTEFVQVAKEILIELKKLNANHNNI